jgi:magnesium transporter
MGLAVSVSLFGAVATAPLIALSVTQIFKLEHTDPATGTGPIATVIQDTVSVLIYGFIASAILLS